MPGGTFLVQNKVRPGAYINFIAKAKSLMNVSDRGIATMALPMSWGPEGEIIELLSSDLVDGSSLAKIGYSGTDAESLPFRLCLTNCYQLKAYRADKGSVKASATVGTGADLFTIKAKHGGICGNNIKVIIVKATDNTFTIQTLYRDLLKDTQAGLTAFSEFVPNDYITIETTGTSVLAETAGTTLAGGTNGTVTEATLYPEYWGIMKNEVFNTMGLISSTALTQQAFEQYIKNLREDEGIKVQGVACNYDSDYEGLIKTKNQGFKTLAETVSPEYFVAWVTGISAGAEINESNTKKEVDNAVSITGELTNTEIIDALKNGYFVISKRRDGVITVEKDINSLHTFTAKKSYDFSKNRAIRVLDEVGNTVNLIWEKSYCGKLDNDADGRGVYLADLVEYGNKLQDIHAITNFLGAKDIAIDMGDDLDAVQFEWPIQPVDSMEKLYAVFTVGRKDAE